MRLVILGGGESGVGTAILGKKKGYDVFVSDFGKIKENYKEVLSINSIAWEDEKHTEELILNADLVMKSPGIPEKSQIVKKLLEKLYHHYQPYILSLYLRYKQVKRTSYPVI